MKTMALQRLPHALAICIILAGIAVYIVSAQPAGASAGFAPALSSAAQPATKISVSDAAPYTAQAAAKRATKINSPKSEKRLKSRPGVPATTTTARVAASSTGSELSKARSLLAAQIARHPVLKGSTVEFGDARGYQAICYYRGGRIVISPKHTASLDRIINHEVWHIIDWRDNGRIDWGENVPRN